LIQYDQRKTLYIFFIYSLVYFCLYTFPLSRPAGGDNAVMCVKQQSSNSCMLRPCGSLLQFILNFIAFWSFIY